jgi:hypothetical protein
MKQNLKIQILTFLCLLCYISLYVWPDHLADKTYYTFTKILLLATVATVFVHLYKNTQGEKSTSSIFLGPLISQILFLIFNILHYVSFQNVTRGDGGFNIGGCSDCALPISFYVIILINLILIYLLSKWQKNKIK